MVKQETKLTEEGLKKLEERLDWLRTVKRPEVSERITQAISFGDISENSEYEDAKNEQAFVEGEIISLEKQVANAVIINTKNLDIKKTGVILGAKVELEDLEFKEKMLYEIVGSAEADPINGKISDESPVGRAIMGHKVGEVINVHAPSGMVLQYKIISIKK